MTGDLLEGIAVLLDAEGVGTWREAGAYLPAEVAIVMKTMPQTPDNVISLSTYGVDDAPVLNDSTLGVQILTRGTKDPRAVDVLADGIFDVLHGMWSVELNGVHVVQSWRQSFTPLGQDGNGRHERSDNFYFQLARPSQHRPD